MKSFINSRETVVTDAIEGFLAGAGGLKLARLDAFPDVKVVLRADWDRTHVALVSGGGSGHEPAHAGFVGEGLLTAAVCGEVFASPSVDAVLSAILAVTGEPGCLLIVKNYTGDRLNFGLAAERARAKGLKVEMVVVGDDVAIPDAAQPRGIAGTLFVHKLAGASAASGATLAEVKARAEDAAKNVRSLGLSLSTCTVPGAEREERIPADKAELGLGIHGEPGRETIDLAPADQLVARVAEQVGSGLGAGDRVALMVNSLGGVSPLEMAIVMCAVARTPLAGHVDLVVGPEPLMTSLDMHGFSLTALALNEARREALLAPATSAAWRAPKPFGRPELVEAPAVDDGPDAAPSDDAAVRKALTVGTARLKEIAGEIDALDAKVGDGDAGGTFAAAASAVEARLDKLPMADGAALMGAIGHTLSRVAGGSSGVLLATFFTAAGAAYAEKPSWAGAFREGLERMKRYGGASRGDRTMIDALEPAIDAFAETGSVRAAAKAARGGAEETKAMTRAKAGRSAYVPETALSGVPDPGAEAVARLVEGLAEAFEG